MNTELHDLCRTYFGKSNRKIVYSTIKYLLKFNTASDLTRSIVRIHGKANYTEYRKLIRKPYIIKHLKLWLWWCLYNNLSIKESKKVMKKFQINKRDINLLRICRRNNLQEKVDHRYECLSLNRFDKRLNYIILHMNDYISKFTYKKLRFLSYSGFSDSTDTYYELQLAGINGIFYMYPKIESRLHAINIYKSSVQRHGCNMIKYHTTKSRAVLTKNDDNTFTSKKVSMTSPEDGSQEWGNSFAMVAMDGRDVKLETEDKLTSESLLNMPGKYGEFFNLICGNYDEKFSSYIKDYGIIRANDEYFDQCLNRNLRGYIKLAAQYSGLSMYEANKLLYNIKNNIGSR